MKLRRRWCGRAEEERRADVENRSEDGRSGVAGAVVDRRWEAAPAMVWCGWAVVTKRMGPRRDNAVEITGEKEITLKFGLIKT